MVTEDLDEGRSLELGYYAAVVRRRWYVVLAGLIVGVLGGFGYLYVTPKMATATATVNVNVISSAPFDITRPASQLLDPQTEVQLATSSQVLGNAALGMGNGMSLRQMRAHTVVQPVAGATVVKISYTAPKQADAIKGADAIASDYLDYRSTAAVTKVDKVVNKLNDRRDALKKALLVANKRILNAQTGSPQEVQAESDRQLIDVELTSLVTQINQLDSVDTSGGDLISTASQSTIKFSPNPKIVLGAGALLGLFVGVLMAFVVNRFDRRVADARALTASGGGAVLSELPTRRARIPATGPDLDQIRSLRERLFATLPAGATLVVVDLVIRDRPSDVAVNLALSMVEGRSPVRLVLPDHTEQQVALLEGALGLEPLASASHITSYASRAMPGLQVVVTSEDHELGTPGDRLGNLLTQHDDPTLTTVVSMPPGAARSLCLTAGRLGHAIILVAAQRRTRVEAVRELAGELAAVGAVIHGSVLVSGRRTVDVVALTSPPAAAATGEPRHVADADDADDADDAAEPGQGDDDAAGAEGAEREEGLFDVVDRDAQDEQVDRVDHVDRAEPVDQAEPVAKIAQVGKTAKGPVKKASSGRPWTKASSPRR